MMPRPIFQFVLVAILALLLPGCGSTGNSTGKNTGNLSASDTPKYRRAPGYGIVYFDVSEAEIKSEFESVIEDAAEKLNANPNKRMILTGHSDRSGSTPWNMWIAKLRARAVRDALINLGVSPSQLIVVSHGPNWPAVTAMGRAARAKNRRVEFALPR